MPNVPQHPRCLLGHLSREDNTFVLLNVKRMVNDIYIMRYRRKQFAGYRLSVRYNRERISILSYSNVRHAGR